MLLLFRQSLRLAVGTRGFSEVHSTKVRDALHDPTVTGTVSRHFSHLVNCSLF